MFAVVPDKNIRIHIIMITMLKFVDRQSELDDLTHSHNEPGFSFTVIYGRRRVGKTELVRQFMRDKTAIYYQCDRRGTAANVLSLRRIAASHFGDTEPAVESLEDLFSYIVAKAPSNDKLVVAIDEFPYLIEQDKSVTSQLQKIIDTVLVKCDIHLILLGSSIGMMKDHVLNGGSPLYGRRTTQIEVRPFEMKQVVEFFPSMDATSLVETYGAFGGMPFYLQFVDPDRPLYENLTATVLNKAHVLYSEGEFLLREELPQASTYLRVLEAIARGATRVSEIASKVELNASDLPHYLERLQKLELIRKTQPVLVRSKSARKSLYHIADHFLRFWLRYVLPNVSLLEYRDSDPVVREIKESLQSFLGLTFEAVTREYLYHLNRDGRLPFKFRVLGRQWGRIPGRPRGENQYEIDHIAYDQLGKSILIGEAKWQDNVDPVGMENRMEKLLQAVPALREWKSIHLIGFARSFRKRRSSTKMHQIDINDIVSDYRSCGPGTRK